MILAVAFSSVINIAAGVLILVCDSSHLPFYFHGFPERTAERFSFQGVCVWVGELAASNPWHGRLCNAAS